MTTPNIQTPTAVADQVRAIVDLPAFARKSGIPYRTLFRIKHTPGHGVSTSVRIVIESAIKRLKPAMTEAD